MHVVTTRLSGHRSKTNSRFACINARSSHERTDLSSNDNGPKDAGNCYTAGHTILSMRTHTTVITHMWQPTTLSESVCTSSFMNVRSSRPLTVYFMGLNLEVYTSMLPDSCLIASSSLKLQIWRAARGVTDQQAIGRRWLGVRALAAR